MIRVLLIDGLAQVRCGLRMRLGIEPDMAVVGEAGDAEQALALARSVPPDVIVVDIGLRGGCGADLVRCLRVAAPFAAVVTLTLHCDGDARAAAQAAGAHACLEKRGEATELVQAIRRIAPHPLAERVTHLAP